MKMSCGQELNPGISHPEGATSRCTIIVFLGRRPQNLIKKQRLCWGARCGGRKAGHQPAVWGSLRQASVCGTSLLNANPFVRHKMLIMLKNIMPNAKTER